MLKQFLTLCCALALAGCMSVSETLPPDGQAANPDRPARKHDPKTLRARVATAVEGHIQFRTLLDGGAPKLTNVRIAGPLDKGLICVSARLETGFVPVTRVALISDMPTADGASALTVSVLMPSEYVSHREPTVCTNAYQPFPELEQLRNRRRAEQGKSA